MSRSKRRTPYIRQEKKDCHYLNRRLRHNKYAEISSGASYRKADSGGWDWGYIWTREQAEKDYENPRIKEKYSFAQWMNCYERWAVRK